MHQFLSSISLRLGSPPCSLLSSCTTLTSTPSVYISAPSARYVCILSSFPGHPGNEANVYMHHTWTGKRFVTFRQIVIKMATKSHYVYNKSRYKWFLCINSWLLYILCVLLQGDSCEEVGIQLVQTLTVVFPLPIRGGLIGKSPQFQLSMPKLQIWGQSTRIQGLF